MIEMKIKKSRLAIWIIIFLMILSASFHLVSALGVRPANTAVPFEEKESFSGQIWIVNNEQRDFTVKVYLVGEMAKYVKVDTSELNFRSDDDAKPINFEVKMTEEDKLPPGTSTAAIVIEEELEDSSPNVISSKIVLKHKINFLGPYPDKYVEARLNFHDLGNEIEFVSEVENKGKEDISQLQTKFYVNDKEEKLHVLETESTDLTQGEDKLLVQKMDKDLFEQGQFSVSAVTSYDGQIVEINKDLLVGKPEVEVTYFDKYFLSGKINQYSLDLLNKWNQKVENVYVDVNVKKDNQKIDEFRTKSTDIEGLMTKRINDYLDARDKSLGKYSFEMVVNFWNTYKMEQKTFESEIITEEDYNSLPKNLAGQASGPTGGSEVYLLWSILGLLLLVIVIYVIYRYAHREEYE